ncbi:guanylate kinase [Sphingobium sp. B2D3A]|uniref:guanylate kinase n=1 Tax=Sphingobium TaxID=165695 RepID=UPI0015EB6A56|nr:MULTISPECIES: guanylate kinase [Sphingobium]MCW2337044.1 guanylate kinase [Sphingobium sp. B2D3A]MCW2362759.1 guanylate kinase [Sphingobium sp. B10D3B]MCW2380898.1 guanylate kinase [Sphingobium sp. B2D3B]MCW2386797.1 guanylate kinase [Sphingobium sp. B2D3D]MCW2388961.1 guanylate kinase [Sphingobium sp. B11D3B]
MADMTDPVSADPLAQPASFKRRGMLFVLSSPSGAGKSTISRKLLAHDPGLTMSVSATTRPMRPGEVDGKDYHFVDLERFRAMVTDNQFLEWAHVFDHRYGTPRAPVEGMLEAGHDVLFDIDWQGAQQLHQLAGGDVVRVFILPPSMIELEARLRGRGTDSNDVIERRMARAHSEIAHWDGYDYVLVNDDAEACFAKVLTILQAERLKRHRQTGIIGFIRKLDREEI